MNCRNGHDLDVVGVYQRKDRAECRACKSATDRRYREGHRTARMELHRAYRQTDAGRAARKRAHDRDEASGAHAARKQVRRYVLAGRLTPLPCEACGAPTSEAHHPFGYGGPKSVLVTWLCRTHHEAMHHPATPAPEEALE